MNYWRECIVGSLEEVGINATDEQVDTITKNVEMAHDMYGEAHGHHFISNPLKEENDKLQKALDLELRKIFCKECKGRGRIYIQGPHHGSDSECWQCRGEGKHLP